MSLPGREPRLAATSAHLPSAARVRESRALKLGLEGQGLLQGQPPGQGTMKGRREEGWRPCGGQ